MENILTIKSTLKINLKQKKEPLDSNSPDWKYLAHDPSNPKENYIVVSEKSFKIYYKGEEMPSHSPLRGSFFIDVFCLKDHYWLLDYNSKSLYRINLEGKEFRELADGVIGSHIGKSMKLVYEDKYILALNDVQFKLFEIKEDLTIGRNIDVPLNISSKFFDFLGFGEKKEYVAGVNHKYFRLYEMHLKRDNSIEFKNIIRLNADILFKNEKYDFGPISYEENSEMFFIHLMKNHKEVGFLLIKYHKKKKKLQYYRIFEFPENKDLSWCYPIILRPLFKNILIGFAINLDVKGRVRPFLVDVATRDLLEIKDFNEEILGNRCSRLVYNEGDGVIRGICQNGIIYEIEFYLDF